MQVAEMISLLEQEISRLRIAIDALEKYAASADNSTQAQEKAPANPAKAKPQPARQSMAQTEGDRVRALWLANKELGCKALREKFKLTMAAETIRQILLNKIYPSAKYSPAEYEKLHCRGAVKRTPRQAREPEGIKRKAAADSKFICPVCGMGHETAQEAKECCH